MSRAAPFDDPDWVFELKHDGYRVLAIHAGSRASLLSRRGNELIGQFPEIAVAMQPLPDCVIDGELVILDGKGHSIFHALRGRCAMKSPATIARGAAEEPAAVFAFDLLALKGKDLRKLPLVRRKAMLLKTLPQFGRIVYTQHIGENGKRLFQAAEQLALEGIVAKRAQAPYPRGRSHDWLKIKTAAGLAIDEERAKWNER